MAPRSGLARVQEISRQRVRSSDLASCANETRLASFRVGAGENEWVSPLQHFAWLMSFGSAHGGYLVGGMSRAPACSSMKRGCMHAPPWQRCVPWPAANGWPRALAGLTSTATGGQGSGCSSEGAVSRYPAQTQYPPSALVFGKGRSGFLGRIRRRQVPSTRRRIRHSTARNVVGTRSRWALRTPHAIGRRWRRRVREAERSSSSHGSRACFWCACARRRSPRCHNKVSVSEPSPLLRILRPADFVPLSFASQLVLALPPGDRDCPSTANSTAHHEPRASCVACRIRLGTAWSCTLVSGEVPLLHARQCKIRLNAAHGAEAMHTIPPETNTAYRRS